MWLLFICGKWMQQDVLARGITTSCQRGLWAVGRRLTLLSRLITYSHLAVVTTAAAAASCGSSPSKSELLVVLKQPEGLEGPTHISLITDNSNHLVLHWGTCKPGKASKGPGWPAAPNGKQSTSCREMSWENQRTPCTPWRK